MVVYTRKGFTLAEVLLTLTIIGIIASYVIPTLMQNIQDAQLKAALKHNYSLMNQATQRVLLDNAGSMVNISPGRDHMVLRNKYLEYFNTILKCSYGAEPATKGNCWHLDTDWKRLNGTDPYTGDIVVSAILNNGALVTVYSLQDDCLFATFGGGTFYVCGHIKVDVNGFKGPNVVGRDIFEMWIQKDRLMPKGTQGDGRENTCNASNTGEGCAAFYLKQ